MLEDVLSKKIDVKNGKLTFGQRIDIGKILQSEISEVEKFEKIIFTLHEYTPLAEEYKALLDYLQEIMEGILHWVEMEKLLRYEPSMEEKQAGIVELSEVVQEMGVVKALAKAFAQDPDTILSWEYSKVFGILYTDLKEYEFQKKLNNIMELKYKK